MSESPLRNAIQVNELAGSWASCGPIDGDGEPWVVVSSQATHNITTH